MNDAHNDERRAAQQLALAFTHDTARGRDDLLVSGPLNAAVSMIDNWPVWPAPVVVLSGPVGCGKSHLAHIWQKKSDARLIHPTKGSNAALDAAAGPVLFEDADRAGFDDTELFHVINSVRENGHFLLVTSRSWPAAWPVTLPDLRSRLKAATVIEIGMPDDDLLAQVIVKLFADRQLYIDDKIVGYIVARMERSLDTARILVDKIDRLALSRASRITRSLAAEALNDLDGAQDGN